MISTHYSRVLLGSGRVSRRIGHWLIILCVCSLSAGGCGSDSKKPLTAPQFLCYLGRDCDEAEPGVRYSRLTHNPDSKCGSYRELNSAGEPGPCINTSRGPQPTEND